MSKYKTNKIMELLGYQYWVNDDERTQIQDVIDAYNGSSDLISLAVDIFNLGKIYGIRKERSRG